MNKKRIAILAIFVGIFIFFLKLAANFTSNSVALLSDALESIINIVILQLTEIGLPLSN